MEMTFGDSSSSHSGGHRSTDRSTSVRNRGISPYDIASLSSGTMTDSDTTCTGSQTPTKSSSGGKAAAFLSNLLGRKPSSASSKGHQHTPPTAGSPSTGESGGTLPRSSRSMPPSPFSSLKRTKSGKKKRTTTASPPSSASIGQSLSPVSPGDADSQVNPFFPQGRSQSLRSSHGIHSPMTPPSPTVDLIASRLHPMHFSPPPPPVAASMVTTTSKPSSQPISIAFQRSSAFPSSTYAARGSPVANLNLNLRVYDHQDVGGGGYGVPQHTRAYSSSPGRSVAMMPTLSPLPEVLFCNNSKSKTDKSGQNQLKPASGGQHSVSETPDSGYMNMTFGPTPATKFTFDQSPNGPSDALPSPASLQQGPSQPVYIPMTKGAAAATSMATENKENDRAIIPPINEASAAVSAVESVAVIPPDLRTNEPTPPSSVPPVNKQRANSLEKIVGAFEKIKIGPKRHSSGDKPLKRSSANLIIRCAK